MKQRCDLAFGNQAEPGFVEGARNLSAPLIQIKACGFGHETMPQPER
jgi:hypothetical protein